MIQISVQKYSQSFNNQKNTLRGGSICNSVRNIHVAPNLKLATDSFPNNIFPTLHQSPAISLTQQSNSPNISRFFRQVVTLPIRNDTAAKCVHLLASDSFPCCRSVRQHHHAGMGQAGNSYPRQGPCSLAQRQRSSSD